MIAEGKNGGCLTAVMIDHQSFAAGWHCKVTGTTKVEMIPQRVFNISRNDVPMDVT